MLFELFALFSLLCGGEFCEGIAYRCHTIFARSVQSSSCVPKEQFGTWLKMQILIVIIQGGGVVEATLLQPGASAQVRA